MGIDIGGLRQVLLGKTGQVNFADRVGVDRSPDSRPPQAVIDRALWRSCWIEQDAAATALSQLGQKLGLPISPPVAGRRRILDEQLFLPSVCCTRSILSLMCVQSGPGVGRMGSRSMKCARRCCPSSGAPTPAPAG